MAASKREQSILSHGITLKVQHKHEIWEFWIAQNKIWSDKQRQKKWNTGRDLGGNVSFYRVNFKQEHMTDVSRGETGWMPKHSFHNL